MRGWHVWNLGAWARRRSSPICGHANPACSAPPWFRLILYHAESSSLEPRDPLFRLPAILLFGLCSCPASFTSIVFHVYFPYSAHFACFYCDFGFLVCILALHQFSLSLLDFMWMFLFLRSQISYFACSGSVSITCLVTSMRFSTFRFVFKPLFSCWRAEWMNGSLLKMNELSPHLKWATLAVTFLATTCWKAFGVWCIA